MKPHDFFSTRDSDCERFLSAPLWEETGGAPLSVMSAFARLGLEPWAEADRLRHLSPHGAAAALAESLSRLPVIGADFPDYVTIATRLVKLLPERAAAGVGRAIAKPIGTGAGWWLAAAAGVAFLLQMNGWLF
jgi:hypothetical protein